MQGKGVGVLCWIEMNQYYEPFFFAVQETDVCIARVAALKLLWCLPTMSRFFPSGAFSTTLQRLL
jgi:hypothetical protein